MTDPEVVDQPDETPDETPEETLDATEDETPEVPKRRSRVDWTRVTAYGLLPALALILAMTAGVLKYVDNSARDSATVRDESVRAATAATISLLSYTPDKVEQQLNDARRLLTGEFLDSYTSLINQVVIPGAKEQQISATATVPRAGSVSVKADEAVVLVFVNQAVTVGADPPTSTASSVQVKLVKTNGTWLVSEFNPI